jgi:SAM-dependent methyltransferase
MSLEEARRYVGSDEVCGALQLELLKLEGCVPESKVLEVGCGMLNAGFPVIQYLNKGNYGGIDPNKWLIDCALEQKHILEESLIKKALFLHVSDFDASSFGIKFDFVLSHSVLSHAARWQLSQFLRNVGNVLAPNGKIIASIRLAEGNPWGNPGTEDKKDSLDETWQYSGNSFFTMDTILNTSKNCGLRADYKPEYTQLFIRTRPMDVHDWFVWRKL